MSQLRDRLSRLKVLGSRVADEPGSLETTPSCPDEPCSEIWKSMDCRPYEGGSGVFMLRIREFPLGVSHGKYRLGEFMEAAAHLAGLSGIDGQPPAPEKVLFLDTETTGLGVGAGNVPFMVGIGFYRNASYRIEQMLIRNPAEEYAMLDYLNALFFQFTHVVSYNGKAFDWNVLKNRYVLNRLNMCGEHLLQLDFLYPARSLWKNLMESCRLGTVENVQLGFFREDDVPGSLAPKLYFEFLAEKNPEVLQGVYAHNEMDILSLASLAIHLARVLDDSGENLVNPSSLTADEVFYTAVWLDKLGRRDRTEALFRQLMGRESLRRDFMLVMARWFKRAGEGDTALHLWQQCVMDPATLLTIEPLVELAKHYEHRVNVPESALTYAKEGLSVLNRRRNAGRKNERSKADRDHADLCRRIERLEQKIDKRKRDTAAAQRDDALYPGTLI